MKYCPAIAIFVSGFSQFEFDREKMIHFSTAGVECIRHATAFDVLRIA
jgi:hypothetical protein